LQPARILIKSISPQSRRARKVGEFILSRIVERKILLLDIFFIQRDIKKAFLIEVEHKLQIEYQQTLRKTENDNQIPLITIPIDIGDNTFTMLCPLSTAILFNKVYPSFLYAHPYVTGYNF
jgi:hypothetical protein